MTAWPVNRAERPIATFSSFSPLPPGEGRAKARLSSFLARMLPHYQTGPPHESDVICTAAYCR